MALEHWWEAVSPAAPEMARDFMTRMMDQGKQFSEWQRFSGKAESDGQATDWRDLRSTGCPMNFDLRAAWTQVPTPSIDCTDLWVLGITV